MSTNRPPRETARILTRVRALLAKAESTEFEPEAEALTERAQALITRYALTDVMLDEPRRTADGPGRVVMRLDRPYADAKARLLTAVASANHCDVVFGDGWTEATVFGFPADLDGVELLYTSLLVQATGAMLALGSMRDWYGTNRTRSFRRSFLLGFAFRVGERLGAARARAEAEVESDFGMSLVPVMADRSARVEAARRAEFPHTVPRRARPSHHGGLTAGRDAADRAQLSSALADRLDRRLPGVRT